MARSLLRKVVGNAGWQISDKLLRTVCNLLVGIWVARYLGPADFGSLNFAIAFAALFFPITELGLQAVVVRELIRRPLYRPQILASAVTLRIGGAVVAFFLCASSAFLWETQDGGAAVLSAVVALSFFPQVWDVIEFDYQARMHPAPVVAVRAASLMSFAAIRIGLIMNGASVLSFAIAQAGEAAFSGLLLWGLSRRQSRPIHLSGATLTELRHLLRSSWPLALSAISVILYMRLDQVMLGRMLDDRAVGVFSAAVRISESWYFVPMAVVAAVAPPLTLAHQRDDSEYRRKLLAVIRALTWLGVGAAVVLTVTARPLVHFLYGASYEDAAAVLAVHAWAGVFASLGIASGPWFINAGLLTLRMANTFGGALVNFLLNLYAIPRYGALGAAVSTLVSYGVAGLLLNALRAESRPVFFLQLRSLTLR